MGETVTTIFPAGMVESVLAQYITQVKNTMDCIIAPPLADDGEKKLTDVQNMKATFLICAEETKDILAKLKPYSNASLTTHHRFCRAMLEKFDSTIMELNEPVHNAKSTHKRECVQFARELVKFISAFHTVLHRETDMKDKEEITQSYLGYLPASSSFDVN